MISNNPIVPQGEKGVLVVCTNGQNFFFPCIGRTYPSDVFMTEELKKEGINYDSRKDVIASYDIK